MRRLTFSLAHYRSEVAALAMDGWLHEEFTLPPSQRSRDRLSGSMGERTNSRTCAEAIAAARREAASSSARWYRLCLAFVAEVYGWAASCLATATTAWRTAQATGTSHRVGGL